MNVGAVVAATAALAFAAPASAAPDPACLQARADRYAAAQVAWQRTVADLVAADAPALRASAFALRDDQLDRIELRRLAIADRLRTALASLPVDRPIAQWLDLDPRARADLARRDPRVAEIAARIDARAAGPPPADGDAVRTAMRERVAKGEAYRRALARLDAEVAAANARTCPG